jgi:Periplasmic component of the Tol biopolymer transport system
MSSIRLVAAASLLAVSTVSAQQATPQRAFQLADWYKLTTLSAPAMSPAGDRVAVTVTTVREAENKRHSEVWVVPTAGGEPQRFTSPGTESSAPHWSPDGKWLFFTSSRAGGKGNRWAIRMDQPSGEAMQVEHYPSGSTPRDHRFTVWAEADSAPAPDSTKMTNDPFAKMLPMARPPYGAVTKPANPARFDGKQVVDMRYKSNDAATYPVRERRASIGRRSSGSRPSTEARSVSSPARHIRSAARS